MQREIATLVSALALAVSPVLADTGFHGTVNNYHVKMNPNHGAHWFHVDFQAMNNGTIHAPITVTNDSWEGYCGRLRVIARDQANPSGNVLLDVLSPRFCVGGRNGPHESVTRFDWTFQATPAVGLSGQDLYMVPVEYRNTGIDLGDIIGTAKQVAEMVASVL